jgi:hypothetical protein
MTQIDREALSDFVSSHAWAWFSAYVTREWGPSGLRYQQAVRDAAQNANAVVELQKVLAAQEAVLTIMKHPSESLAQMKAKGIPALQGESRRGPGL